MICSKCNSENAERNLFCSKCGAQLVNGVEGKAVEKGKPRNKINIRKTIILISSILVVTICLCVGIIILNNPVRKFEGYVKGSKYDAAAKLYADKIKENKDENKKVTDFLESEIKRIEKSYTDEKIDYNKAVASLGAIEKLGPVLNDAPASLEKINKLNDSRAAFKKAEEAIKANDYVTAIKEYKNVISEDKNYSYSQEQVKKYMSQYKEMVLKNSEDSSRKQDYEKAISTVEEALTLLPNDADLTAKDSSYKKLQAEKLEAEKKQKMEDAKNNQEVVVVSCKVVPDYFEINDEAQITFKNNSNKVIKNLFVGVAMYDANGYPLKSGTLAGDDILYNGKAENVNIQPSQTFGDNNAWNLYTNYGTIKNILACVKEIEYYDGSTWKNPYYDYWYDAYVGKQYK